MKTFYQVLLASSVFVATALPILSQTPAPFPSRRDTLGGRFIPGYIAPSDTNLVAWYDLVKDDSVAETVASYLNATIKLPFDIRLQFQQCRRENAFYQPASHAVAFCYEFMDQFLRVFRVLDQSDSVTTTWVSGTTNFFLYHEVGHALVHALDLPVPSSEETVVDGLATYLLASDEDDKSDARQAVEAVVQYQSLRAEKLKAKRLGDIQSLLTDEHALDQTRLTQIACWLFGENPERYSSWINPDILPASRAKRCVGEYQALRKYWDRVLDPYIKE